MKRAVLVGLLITLLLWVAGCGGGMPGAHSAGTRNGAPQADSDDSVQIMEAESARDEAPPAPPPEPMPVSAAATGGAAPPVQAPMKKPAAMDKSVEFAGQAGESKPKPGVDTPAKPAVASQLLVYTADVRVAVQEVSKAIDAVEKLAKERGGYLVSREDNSITIRVPSAKFDLALDELGKLGEVLHRNVSIEDVTDLYFDMQVRMKNLEIVKNRLEELLKKAATVDEALAVQRELERVTSALESMRGKLKLLTELVLFSTITVAFEPKSTEHIDSKVRLPFPWMDRLGLGDLMRL